MKKRLFISSILMTLVLLVAITTATFAWYQASSSGVSTHTQGQLNSIQTNKNAVTLDGITLTAVVLDADTEGDTDVPNGHFEGVDLVNASNQSSYWNGQSAVAHPGTVALYEEIKVVVTASIGAGTDIDDAVHTLFATAGAKKLNLNITVAGNVKIDDELQDSHLKQQKTALTIELTEAAYDASSDSWTVTLYYAVRANNEWGPEFDSTTGAVAYETAIATEGGIKVGDLISNSTKYYVAKAAITSGTFNDNSLNLVEVLLHDSDAITAVTTFQ